MGIRIDPHGWLKQRRRGLTSQRNQANLCKIQSQAVFQQRINRRDQRLKHIVHEMGKANGSQDFEAEFLFFVQPVAGWINTGFHDISF
jgi:hypothetical protein